MYYKGYRVGSIERGLLKIILNVKNRELPSKYSESFSDIFKTIRQKSEYSNVIRNMVEKGFMRFLNKNGELKVVLTQKGEIIGKYITRNYSKKEKPINWDKKWRLVMFDIPEKKKRIRNLLRFHLKKIGFVQIQGSVWIYPYPCEEIVSIIKTYFNLNNEVLYFTVEYLENDKKFKKLFKI